MSQSKKARRGAGPRRTRLMGSRMSDMAIALMATLSLLAGILFAAEPLDQASADESTTGDDVTIAITASTSVVTATSGLHITATISNPTSNTLPGGTLTASTNPWYTFVSKNDIQQWADAKTPIPTPTTLSTISVPSIQAESHISVSIDADSQDEAMKKLTTWGPKPLLLEYQTSSDSARQVTAHTFLTRSNDGLSSVKTPAMSLTVAVPLTSRRWSTNTSTLSSLLTKGPSTTSSDASDARTGAGITALASPSADDLRDWKRVLASHPLLQSIADPEVVEASTTPLKVSGIMQTSAFDITAAATASSKSLSDAGIDESSWSASTALDQARSSLGDDDAAISSYAWQGSGQWTRAALTTAARQGFTTVIAEGDFNGQDTGTIHTGKYVVSTDSGNVTVLAAQDILSQLAQGQSTSASADAEGTSAGRLARFMAQSAFFQMQEPYVSRNPLVLLDASTTPKEAAELMTSIESASWLTLTDLTTLSNEKPYLSGSQALAVLPQSSGISAARKKSLHSTLSSLTTSRSEITRFSTKVLDESSSPSPTTSSTAATQQGHWTRELLAAQSAIAIRSLAWPLSDASRTSLSAKASSIAKSLYSAITLTPSEGVTVVSETASMPVTVSNANPYPVHVKLSSLTDSMEIVTSRFSEAVIPAHSETQVTFTIRVATSGSAIARIAVLDRDGDAISDERTTTITSSLQINDKSGLVIIVIAVIFAVLGLWRQFHRRKDPDE
ncbi:hypothetical protein BMIN_1116 [Bifidobacterium minimum]|uniref:Uncharacterized protein n=2 Tax=Bifidobacterium minimum TaxID=1693 RepID=A0A087BT69_9BIFI|nr:hypothetical protein BMIN_1116 [Bifidobacterium minimum]